MIFRQYSTTEATVKEWARQLNIANKGIYRLYPTLERTLSDWKNELNKNIGINTFSILNNPESTLKNWQEKLNSIYNK